MCISWIYRPFWSTTGFHFRSPFKVVCCHYQSIRLFKALLDVHAKNLILHAGKCKVVLFFLKHEVINYSYIVNGSFIPRFSTYSDLRIIPYIKLSFVSHINKLSNSCFCMLGFSIRNTPEIFQLLSYYTTGSFVLN